MKIQLYSALFFLLIGCSGSESEVPDTVMTIPDDGYRYFRICSSYDEKVPCFLVRSSHTETLCIVESQLSLPREERSFHISGIIDRGNYGYNYDWSWSFKDNEWTLVEFSIELCDGDPRYIEDNLDYFIDVINGQYCPWSSIVDKELFPGEPIE